MAEVLVEFADPVMAGDGTRYLAQACGTEVDNGMWHGWLEFVDPVTGAALRSGRETTQPNRADILYWATGLTAVYLEGALERARRPLARPASRPTPQPHFSEPAPNLLEQPPQTDSILNPFSVYRKGEGHLRRQLAALSEWHLANIVRAHALSELPPATLEAMTAGDLIELIVAAVRLRAELPTAR
jgi:hypothetical protein